MTLAKGWVSAVLLGITLVFVGYTGVDHQTLLLLIASGILGISVGDTFFFAALQDLGPHALVILLMLGQVVTAGLAVLFLGERPTVAVWGGIGLVITGIGIVLSAKLSGKQHSSTGRGVVFGLISVLCMSGSIIIAKQGLAAVSALQATFIRMLAGTTGMLCFGLVTRQLRRWVLPFRDPKLVGVFLISVGVITFGGFWLSLVAIKHVDVAIANTLSSTEPLFILPLAVIFLKEKLESRAILGTLVTLFGIILLCLN
jgi:drug/metabolite transporter (DMT)-like permease